MIRLIMGAVAKQVIFAGRVQGVGFRFTVFNIANRCRLTGFVRNAADGSVEMIVQGCEDDIEKCLVDVRKTYDVDILETRIEEVPINPQYEEFKITF